MGRPKSYDRDEVLAKAMRLFWERGYHATSTRDLADAMGVNVYSLYAEFESKEGLYRAAMGHYDAAVVTGHFGVLEAPGAGMDDLRGVLRFFGGAAREGNPMLGCLATNAITEQAPNDAHSRIEAARYTERLVGACANALQGAVGREELRADTPVAELASFLAVSLVGVFVMLRAGVDWQLMHACTEQALSRVESFAPRAPEALPLGAGAGPG